VNNIVPVLPCSNVTELIEFYKYLGFELVGQFTRSYVIMKYDELELHFYGTKQVQPEANSTMCIIRTDDLERLYNAFITGLKSNTGKVPRNGFPKITKIRDLSEDMRFTLTDPGGNTFYVLTPKQTGSNTFFRDLNNKQYAEQYDAEQYAILYDLVYSKEDCKIANNMLPKLLSIKEQLDDLDKAKLLLTAIEIQVGLGIQFDETELKQLIIANKTVDDWESVENKFNEIING
jgi:hypothetical protein